MQQIINTQKSNPEMICIKELSSENIRFSIDEKNFFTKLNFANLGLKLESISINFKPISNEDCFLSSNELNALKLLRETFLEIWQNSTKLNLNTPPETPMCGKLCNYSNKLLEKWIYKLAKKCIKY